LRGIKLTKHLKRLELGIIFLCDYSFGITATCSISCTGYVWFKKNSVEFLSDAYTVEALLNSYIYKENQTSFDILWFGFRLVRV
jgi:hypothetical protein